MDPAQDIYTTPAMEAPPGIDSNLENPYSSHHYLVATSAVCLSLSLSAVIGRTFTKAYLLKNMKIEDCEFQSLDFFAIKLTEARLLDLLRGE